MKDEIEFIHKFSKEFKEKWFGEGEWAEEPDVVNFEHLGYKCMVYRVVSKEPHSKQEHWFGGHLCGYVLLPEGHKLYGAKYHDIDIDCHGGLTFSENSEEHEGIDIKKVHLIGFDCAHSGDYCPSTEKLKKQYILSGEITPIPKEFKKYSIFNPVYRNVEFCVNECKSIVDQIIEKEKANEASDGNGTE